MTINFFLFYTPRTPGGISVSSQKHLAQFSKKLLVALKNAFGSKRLSLAGNPSHRHQHSITPSSVPRCIIGSILLYHSEGSAALHFSAVSAVLL